MDISDLSPEAIKDRARKREAILDRAADIWHEAISMLYDMPEEDWDKVRLTND